MFFISLLTIGIVIYIYFIHHRIYLESSDHLLTTYNQVSRTFSLFADRNHYLLHDWDNNIQLIADADDGTVWRTYAERKENWGYTDLYLLNENDEFLAVKGEKGVNENLNVIFDDAYRQNHYVVRSFMSTANKRLVVFAEALSKPCVIDGTVYTCMAVAYDNDALINTLAGNIYKGQSDCYVIDTDGNVMLYLQEKTVFTEHIVNLFDYFKEVSKPEQGTWEIFEGGVANAATDGIAIRYNGHSYYVVYMPVGIDDWTIVGIVNEDAVDSGMRDVQRYTLIILLAVTIVSWVSIVGTIVIFYNKRLQLKEQEKNESEQRRLLADQLFNGVTKVVSCFAVCDLSEDTYEFHEQQTDEQPYPETGAYSQFVDTVSRKFVALTDSENAKLGTMLQPEYLRQVIRKNDDIFRVEYARRNDNIYKVMDIVPVEWTEGGELKRIMLIAQDIGKRVELENLANTDGLTGLFNERYFSQMLHIKEEKKVPFVLYYIDLDRFKPVNDTYGHDMGDKLLKATAERLLKCIRSNDYAFRIGGDEFALVVSAEFSELQCNNMKLRVESALSKTYVIDGIIIKVGASVGYAAYPFDCATASDVRIKADRNMYEDKMRHHTEEDSLTCQI